MESNSQRRFIRCLSLASVDGISSPCYSSASEGSVPATPVESPLRVDCVGTVKKTLGALRAYLPADVTPTALCGALALAVRKEHAWVVRWADSLKTSSKRGPWNSPLSHDCLATPPAWSDCVLAIAPFGAVACVVDTGFRAKFEIGAEGAIYEHVLGRVPAAFVGTPTELLNKVDELSNGVSSCFQYLGRELPPWRTRDSLKRLYKACLENDGARQDIALGRLEAAVRTSEAVDGFTEAEVEGLRAYLRDAGIDAMDAPSWDLFDDEPVSRDLAVSPRPEGSASNLTLLMEGLQRQAAVDAAKRGPGEAVELPQAAWCTVVPGAHGASMPRVKRLADLSAHYYP